jgi:Homeodomain-like domain
MRDSRSGRHGVTAARRGQIVQRVIVDGWTPTDAAAAFGMPRRLVEIWVADYRRHGMASLRRVPRRTIAAEIIELRLLRPVTAVLYRLSRGSRRLFTGPRRADAAPLRGSNDDRRGGSS